jgi:hypothetical protein
VSTVQLNDRLVATLVGIMNDADALLPHGVTDAVDPGNQDEPGDPLSLSGHP